MIMKGALLFGALGFPLAFGNHAVAKATKACFVYVIPVGKVGFTYQHNKGRLEMEKAMAGKVKTSFVENVPEGPDAERVIREMAVSGCKAIFATSFGYMNHMQKVAQQFPDVAFLHATGYKSNNSNFSNYNARFYQGRYVNGVVAGKMTKSNILGYVASFPIPEVLQGINAFVLGARSVNPSARVRVIWVNSWNDPGRERSAAQTLISQGADILTHHTESTATVQAAAEKGKFAFGYHSDMSKYGQKTHLSATIHEWGDYYTKVMRRIINNDWKPENIWGGYKEGMIKTAQLNSVVPVDIKASVAKIEQRLKAGSFKVFSGPIRNQDGKLVLEDGETMDDKTINSINYYFEGVESKLSNK